jgi:uncharacterized protein (TIGR02594 family)
MSEEKDGNVWSEYPDSPWLDVAFKEIGVKEVAGLTDNPRILEYAATTTLRAQSDEVPWCSSFANWVFKQCAIKGTDSAAARSWLNWGQECSARVGALVVLKRGDSSFQGHVGFVVDIGPIFVSVLGGNQSDQVKVSKFLKTKVIGYRWPKA